MYLSLNFQTVHQVQVNYCYRLSSTPILSIELRPYQFDFMLSEPDRLIFTRFKKNVMSSLRMRQLMENAFRHCMALPYPCICDVWSAARAGRITS